MDHGAVVARLGAEARANEPMSEHTTLHIGGPADVFVTVHTAEELAHAVRVARQADLPYTVLGEGANILVADAGIRGVVIENRSQEVAVHCQADGIVVRAESGVPLADLARYCTARGFGGLEWAVDVPGSIGGAVVGNAGAYGGRMSDIVCRVAVLTRDSEIATLGRDDLQFGYRTSILKADRQKQRERAVVLWADMVLAWGVRELLEQQAADFSRRRWARQPPEPSAGSIFKRTADYPPGYLVEKAGLKGLRLGQAQISPQHANVIVNLGGARAADVKALIDIARLVVRERFGQGLELEIELMGEWPPDEATLPPWNPEGERRVG